MEDAWSHGTPGFAVKGKFLTWDGWTYLLVRLANVREGDLQDLFERAWRHEAPKRLVAAYDAVPKS